MKKLLGAQPIHPEAAASSASEPASAVPARDIPIIFSGPMVRALLDGHKTMTRRLAWQERHLIRADGSVDATMPIRPWPSPWQRVQPGDRLWVRESHYLTDDGDYERAVYAVDREAVREYLANLDRLPRDFPKDVLALHRKLRPSIHMPRWASRLTLTVTAVKIGRLNLICHNDLLREGVFQAAPNSWMAGDNIYAGSAYAAFQALWNRLHGPEAWDENPEVVALTFTVERRNIDAVAA